MAAIFVAINVIHNSIRLKKYYLNVKPQETGEHEVHNEFCPWLKFTAKLKYLGDFNSCTEAVEEARKYYSNIDGCKACSSECHTR